MANIVSRVFIKGIENQVIKRISNSERIERAFIKHIARDTAKLDKYGNPIKAFANVKKYAPTAVGIWITGFYMNKTLKADIPKERKQTLTLNCAITGIIGAVGGLALGKAIDNTIDTLKDKIGTAYKKDLKKGLITETKLQLIKNGAKAAIPLATTSFAFRYLAPVLATPLADQATKALKVLGIFKPEQKVNIQEQKLNILK